MSLRMVADIMGTSLDVCSLLHNIRPMLTFAGYPMPNDEVLHPQISKDLLLTTLLKNEMDREDMKHHFTMLITKGRLHLAPIGPNPETILDIGTGTGELKLNLCCCVT
jgi:hypothetical protein